MDNHQPKVDKVPHSNSANVPDALRETPVEEFDMTLQEAHDAGKVSPLPLTEAPEPQYGVESPVIAPETQTSVEAPKRKLSLIQKIGFGAASVAVAAGAVFGTKAIIDNTGEAPTPNTDGTSQIDEGNQEPSGTEEEQTPEVNEMDEILNLPKPERFDELDNMTIEQFNQQPIEARVEYAAWLNRDNQHLAELWFEATESPLDQLAINMTVNPDNTGEEVRANVRGNLRGALSRHFEEYELEQVPLYENLQRQKIVSGSYLYPSHPVAEEWRASAADEKINGYVPDFYATHDLILADEEVTSRSETHTITDQAGIERTAVDLTWREADGKEVSGTYVLIQTATTSQWVLAG